MSDTGRLAGFTAALAVVFVAALGLGRVTGPVGPGGAPADAPGHSTGTPAHDQR